MIHHVLSKDYMKPQDEFRIGLGQLYNKFIAEFQLSYNISKAIF